MPFTNPHLKLIIKILLIFFFFSIILIYAYLLIKQPFYLTDFNSYYTAAQIFIQEPQNLYDFTTQQLYQSRLANPENLPRPDYLIPYANPPFFLLLYLPLTLFPPATAYFINLIFNLFLLSTAIFFLNRLFAPPNKLLLILFTFSLPQTFSILLMNQNAFIGLLLFLGIYYFHNRRQYFLTGLIASLLLYKPQLAILIFIYLLLQKNIRVLSGLFTGLLMLGFISTYLDPYFPSDFLTALSDFSSYSHASPLNRVTWWGFFLQIQQYFTYFPVTFLSIIFSILTVTLIFRTIYPFKTKLSLSRLTLLILGTLLASLHAHGQETILLLIPLYYFTQQANKLFYLLLSLGWIIFFLDTLSRFYDVPPTIFPTLYLIGLLIIFLYNTYPPTKNPANQSL